MIALSMPMASAAGGGRRDAHEAAPAGDDDRSAVGAREADADPHVIEDPRWHPAQAQW
jgi:hypothetical protein